MAHDTTALPLALEKQAVTPGPLTEGSHHLNNAAVEDDSLSDYYTNDENEINDILSKQEEEAYNVLASCDFQSKISNSETVNQAVSQYLAKLSQNF